MKPKTNLKKKRKTALSFESAACVQSSAWKSCMLGGGAGYIRSVCHLLLPFGFVVQVVSGREFILVQCVDSSCARSQVHIHFQAHTTISRPLKAPINQAFTADTGIVLSFPFCISVLVTAKRKKVVSKTWSGKGTKLSILVSASRYVCLLPCF